jgi:transcriptional regulator with GAF, ATPase, and Fis domain
MEPMMNRDFTLEPAETGWLIIYDLSQRIEHPAVASMLELAASITHCDVAHLYWMDPAAYELRLVGASSTPEDCRIPRMSVEWNAGAREWMEGLETATVLSAGVTHFSRFPETVASRVAGLAVFPLRVEGMLAGILTLARSTSNTFRVEEIEAAGKLGNALVAAMRELERGREVELLRARLRSARQEKALLENRLAERKIVERAKGLLQAHYGWTEEDAFYHIRRTSRQQRTPMSIIAQRIIDITAAREGERLTA